MTPESTAESGANLAPLGRARSRASVVLPVPGPPQRISEGSGPPPSTSFRTSRPAATRWAWPTNSSRVRGRIRSASGASAAGAAGSSSGSPAPKRLRVSCRAMRQTSRGHGRVRWTVRGIDPILTHARRLVAGRSRSVAIGSLPGSRGGPRPGPPPRELTLSATRLSIMHPQILRGSLLQSRKSIIMINKLGFNGFP